jgi:hypothetical protein
MVESLAHHKTLHLDEKLQAQYLHLQDEEGKRWVAISLFLQLPTGQPARFMTDVERLEQVAKRAESYQQRGTQEPRTEQIGDYQATFQRWQPENRAATVGVSLVQEDEKSGRVQRFAMTAEELKAIVREGQAVERELKCEPTHYPIVYGRGHLTDKGDDRVEARVVRSIEGLEQAQRSLKDNEGFALVPVPQRQELARESLIELGRLDKLELKGGKLTTVEGQLAENLKDSEQQGVYHVVARWNYTKQEPKIDSLVFYDGGGRATNGDLLDFRSRPHPGSIAGEPENPKYVLLQIDPKGEPFHAKIVAISDVKVEMTKELVVREQDFARRHRMLTTEFKDQSLGMETHRHEFKP